MYQFGLEVENTENPEGGFAIVRVERRGSCGFFIWTGGSNGFPIGTSDLEVLETDCVEPDW